MPRIRTIKPGFFESEDVAVLPLRARLLWIGLWTHCDDEGRTKDNVKLIKARIWPLDQITLNDIEDDLQTLAVHGRIVRYEADDQRYLAITNWSEHQSINKPTKSKIPSPPVSNAPRHGRTTGLAPAEHYDSEPRETGKSYPQAQSGSSPVAVPDDSLRERKGKERKGRDAGARETTSPPHEPPGQEPPGQEPPPKCDQHLHNPNPPPCGDCAEARKHRNRWEAERSRRDRDAPKCRTHRGQPAQNCGPCRAERIGAE